MFDLDKIKQNEILKGEGTKEFPQNFTDAVESSVHVESLQKEVNPFLNTDRPFLVQDLTNYNTRIKAFQLLNI
jgi:hypothetical protein